MVILLLSAGVVLALDQASKALVVRSLGEGQLRPVWVGWPIGIRRITNARVASWFVRRRRWLVSLWVFAVLGTILVSVRAGFDGTVVQIGLGAAVGGATGNFVDGIWRQGVVDFIDLHVWPVFNVADLAIVCGVLGALCFVR